MAFKKSYSTLSKAAIQMKADNMTTEFSNVNAFTVVGMATPYIQKAWGYFKTIGDIPFDDENDYDEENDEYLNGFKEFGSETIIGHLGDYIYGSKILSDGSSLTLLPDTSGSSSGASNYPNCFLTAIVDTNGYKKGPNRVGYDVFAFDILSTGQVIPNRSGKLAGAVNCRNTDVSTTITKAARLRKGACFTHYALADKSPTDTSKSYFKDFLK